MRSETLEGMDKSQMLNHIKQTAANILPKGSVLYLYGSRARGDHHEDSDWDLLLLLDKPKLEHDDFEKYSYPFVLMGWDFGEDVRPHAYTKDEWFNGPHAMFYYNVEEDDTFEEEDFSDMDKELYSPEEAYEMTMKDIKAIYDHQDAI